MLAHERGSRNTKAKPNDLDLLYRWCRVRRVDGDLLLFSEDGLGERVNGPDGLNMVSTSVLVDPPES